MAQVVQQMWSCPRCEYNNEALTFYCIVCKWRKPGADIETHIRRLKDKVQYYPEMKSHTHEETVQEKQKHEKEIAAAIQRATMEFRQTGKQYQDPDFELYLSDHIAGWERPNSIVPRNNAASHWSLFNNPAVEDVYQGKVPNCWIVSSMAAIAPSQQLLGELIRPQSVSEAGIYGVRICKNGQWMYTMIDDRLPCNGYGEIACAWASKEQLWVSLLEKAIAKMHGAEYLNLQEGPIQTSLRLLTGMPTKRIRHCKYETYEIHRLLTDARRNCYPVVSATADDKDCVIDSLQVSHAYAVLKLLDINTKNGLERLIKLRDPHGKTLWNGLWSPDSDQWTNVDEATLPKNERGSHETGDFWMSMEDFRRGVHETSICILQQGWYRQNVVGHLYSLALPTMSCTKITILEPTQIKVHAAFQERKDRREESWERTVLLCMDATFCLLDVESSFVFNLLMEKTLQPGEYYFYLLSGYLAPMGDPLQYNLTCHSDKCIVMEEVIQAADWMTVVIMQTVVAHGKQTEMVGGYTLFSVDSTNFCMDMLIVKNSSSIDDLFIEAKHCLVPTDPNDTELYNQYFLRGDKTMDIIPTDSSMIINTTCTYPIYFLEDKPGPSSHEVTYSYATDMPNYPSCPILTKYLRKLHRSVPNNEIKFPSSVQC